ncbi:TetR family transcriptional regulator C-terminal domain-containing protein [Aquisalimonas sp.]|uniref:TetR family transcriptional regulator C-terminal domain-containing protein n=1 Tax=Aquisalimonas sp. TaxID=1872621 RepID=UPI0025BE118C|nr:TetR family transcriptional regulator C-terminal domain-containing protein [Aquisalimonas sp.]
MNEEFRRGVEQYFSAITNRIGACLDLAREQDRIPVRADSKEMANLLLNRCWVGAALRSCVWRDPAPLEVMLEFYFNSARAEACVIFTVN